MTTNPTPLVGILIGSKSDWDIMQYCAAQLEELNVPWEAQAISAHRAPDALFEYLSTAVQRGLEILIAAAGGAAHLPGLCAAKTTLPVLGVPMESAALKGLDSLLSIVQMPGGVPVGTLAIGKAGATNAALLAISILALTRPELAEKLNKFREDQCSEVRAQSLPPSATPAQVNPGRARRRRAVTCSFCGKSSREVGPMVEGPGDLYMCGPCVSLAATI